MRVRSDWDRMKLSSTASKEPSGKALMLFGE